MAELISFIAGNIMITKNVLVSKAGPETVKVPAIVFYIKSGNHNILVDTGPDPDLKLQIEKDEFPTERTQEQRVENLLKKIGLTVDDIDYVVLTHLHFDHAGSVKEFKKSKIFVQKDEFYFAFLPDWFSKGGYEQSDFNYSYLNYELIEGDYQLTEDVKLLFTPGHTHGSQAIYVTLNSGKKILLAGDACYTLENFGPPKKLPGSYVDPQQWGDSIEKLRHLTILEGAELWPSHDPDFYSKLKFVPYIYK
jgi:N-acyl homoserine lactone hydrolase